MAHGNPRTNNLGQFHGVDTQKPWSFFDGSFKTMIRETWYKSLEVLHKKKPF
jgi:hypothetical protein